MRTPAPATDSTGTFPSQQPTPGRTRAPVVEIGLVLAVVLMLQLWLGLYPDDPRIAVAAGTVSIALGVRVFLGHGGARVTMLGLFNYASGLFVGASGVHAALNTSPSLPVRYLSAAVLVALTLQILTTAAGWQRPRTGTVGRLPDGGDGPFLVVAGGAAVVVLAVARAVGVPEGLSGWAEGAAFTTIVILAVGLLSRQRARLRVEGVVVLVSVLAYAVFFHSGGGRLRIVALACAVSLLVTLRFPRPVLKPVMVAVTPLALIVLAQQRLALQEATSGAGASAGNSGLESMLVPIRVLAMLLQAQETGYPLAWGVNLLSVPASLVPQSWFPGAPRALGYELVALHDPSLYGTGFSTAATVAGEAVFNFGVLGVLPAAAVLGWLCARVDDRLVRSADTGTSRAMPGLTLAFWLIVAGAVGDLVWMGTHIFVMRTLMRLPLLMIVALVLLNARHGGRRRRGGPRSTSRTGHRSVS